MKQSCSLFRLFFAAAIFLVFSCSASHAQTAVYGGFSGAAMNSAPSSTTYGGLVGLYAQSGHYAYFGGDFRGTFLSHNGFHYYTGAVGPRLAFKPPVLPLRPYVEGLAGVASYNSGKNTSSSTHLNYQAVVGMDWTLLPHIDWRVIEYAYSGTTGSVKANIFTTGLAIRLW